MCRLVSYTGLCRAGLLACTYCLVKVSLQELESQEPPSFYISDRENQSDCTRGPVLRRALYIAERVTVAAKCSPPPTCPQLQPYQHVDNHMKRRSGSQDSHVISPPRQTPHFIRGSLSLAAQTFPTLAPTKQAQYQGNQWAAQTVLLIHIN